MTVELKPIPEDTLEELPVNLEAPLPDPVEKTEPAEPAEPEPVLEEPQAPKQKPRRGRPPGSKNKAPRKQTVRLVEQADAQQEVQADEPPPPPPSPRTQRRMYLQETSRRRAELNAMKVRHYSNLLNDMFSY